MGLGGEAGGSFKEGGVCVPLVLPADSVHGATVCCSRLRAPGGVCGCCGEDRSGRRDNGGYYGGIHDGGSCRTAQASTASSENVRARPRRASGHARLYAAWGSGCRARFRRSASTSYRGLFSSFANAVTAACVFQARSRH